MRTKDSEIPVAVMQRSGIKESVTEISNSPTLIPVVPPFIKATTYMRLRTKDSEIPVAVMQRSGIKEPATLKAQIAQP
ncbi:hypothetical protein [Alkalimarinus coralli]|uniref:hypothetical protein n=1 Tax=Alkalimarinus coralli TaxID=2935863 RepID=UPI00202B2764|nr:hypothetical protein [Alkalimarinus coralli]